MKCTKCNSKKVKYQHSFVQEHVYKCKNCKSRIIVKRKIREFIGL
jgi:DNA-directed RNA polymerase subunit RPC12/RpoP